MSSMSASRLLFALRTRLGEVPRWLGSWRLSIVLMVLAALYYAFLAIWATSSPPQVVANIAALAPFWLVYALLLVNTGVCLWRRLPALVRQLSPRLTQGQRPPDWRAVTGAELDRQEVAARLRRGGYRLHPTPGGELHGVRRRWSALGTYLFHGAFFLLALGFLLSLAMRHEAQVWAAVGEELTGRPEQLLSQTPPRLLSFGVPAVSFRVEEVRPEFWRDQLLFTTLEARLALPGGGAATTRINRPVWWSWATFLRLSGFGYAPRYELLDASGRVLDSAFVKMNVFPPGQRDFFKIPGYPHRFYVEVLPDFAVADGDPVTRSLNLANPAVLLRAYRGHLDLGGAVLAAGEAFPFEGLAVRFPEIRYWGEFSIVRDPGAPLLFLSYLLGLGGLALKLRGRRSEVAWEKEREGAAGALRGWAGRPPAWAPGGEAGGGGEGP